MRNIQILAFTLVALLTVTAFAGDKMVKTTDGFSLIGTDGKEHTLSDYKDAKAIVVMFISTKCPVSNGFNERMAELANTYESKGVVFLGINSNKAEKMNEVKEHKQKHDFSFVVLKDNENKVADQFKAKVTPEVFVLNSGGDVLYHGRIDDSADADERKSPDLKNALDDILAGEHPEITETKAFGCSIKRVSM
jgi:peroxiredoxin